MKQEKIVKGYYRLRMIYMKQFILHYDHKFKLTHTMGPYALDETEDVTNTLKESGIINMDTIDLKQRVVPYSDQEKF